MTCCPENVFLTRPSLFEDMLSLTKLPIILRDNEKLMRGLSISLSRSRKLSKRSRFDKVLYDYKTKLVFICGLFLYYLRVFK